MVTVVGIIVIISLFILIFIINIVFRLYEWRLRSSLHTNTLPPNNESYIVVNAEEIMDKVRCNYCSLRKLCIEYGKGRICTTIAKETLIYEMSKTANITEKYGEIA